jgi:chromosome segregation ATPase
MLMAGAFGGRGRAASIPALQGLAGFTQGLGNGNRSQAMKGLDDFKTGISELETTYHNSRQEYEDILRNQDIDIARKREKLMAAASKWNDIQTYNAAQQSAWARIDKQHEQREKGIRDAKKAADDAERKAKEFEFKREDEERANRKEQEQKHRDLQREWNDSNREFAQAHSELRKAQAQTPPVQEAIDGARELLAAAEERRRTAKQELDAFNANMSKGGSAVQGGSPQSKQAIIDEARKAIANHAPPDAVRKRLQENGIDPSELDQPGGETAPSAGQSFGAPTPEIPTIGPAATGGGF